MKYLTALGVAALATVVAVGRVQAQTAGFSFSNATAGTNDPTTLGGAATPFDVWSDSGALVKATFYTLSPSSQFGISDNDSFTRGDAPISGNIVFGGRTNYPTDAGAVGTAILEIKFSQLISGLGFDCITDYQTPNGDSGPLDLNVELVGIGTGTLPTASQWLNSTGFYYQSNFGIGLPGSAFDTVIFSVTPPAGGTYGEFGLDNLVLTLYQPQGTVPEPGVLALLVGAGVPLVWRLRRRVA